jgi:L-ascorbate metabolism protein UlaG (beta-lactamase superfamily)
MKKISLLLVYIFSFSLLLAQRSDPDKVDAENGPIVVQPILHGSLVLQWNKQTIYVDPYGGAAAFSGIAAPSLILITDIHGDHLNLKTLDAIETSGAKIVTCQAVSDQMPEELREQTVVISNGETTTQHGIEIKAIPMYNLPESDDSRHTKGRGNGYVLNLGGKLVYISGDTEDIPEMRALKDIDIAFVCMNLPYTMDIHQAADAVLQFKPKIVYPFHFRGQGGLSDIESFKKLVNKGDKKIEVRLREWYPEYK